ncbi:hypothetical protein AB1Y20_006388 [Prymnesium parvum]|uniref:Calmodulin n=1 Tax=Prymnesium parvum TaxID=97485 RepID=A0AB34J2K8_PRYPA
MSLLLLLSILPSSLALLATPHSRLPLASAHTSLPSPARLPPPFLAAAHDTLVTPLDASTFDAAVDGPGLAVVKFFAPWCRTCARINPIFQKVAAEATKEHGDRVRFYEVNFKEQKPLCASQRIVLLPTVHFYLKGFGRVHRMVLSPKGAAEQLRAELSRFLADEARMETLQELQRGGRDALVRYTDLVKALAALKAAPDALAGDPPAENSAKYGAVASERRLRELEQLFAWLDKDASHSIDAEELAAAAAALRPGGGGGAEDSARLDDLLRRIAAARGEAAEARALDFESFVKIMLRYEVEQFASPEELLPAFEAIDLDGEGTLSMEEVLGVVENMCRVLPSEGLDDVCAHPELIESTFDAFDVDHSGDLSYEEFVSMLSGRGSESAYEQ